MTIGEIHGLPIVGRVNSDTHGGAEDELIGLVRLDEDATRRELECVSDLEAVAFTFQ